MLITATPCSSPQGPAQPGLKLPLHQGWWQEVSDSMGQGDNLPSPLHWTGELWALENVVLSAQSHAVQLSRAVCGCCTVWGPAGHCQRGNLAMDGLFQSLI